MVKMTPLRRMVSTNGPDAGVELGFGFRAEDADVSALVVFSAIEEAALIGSELDDVGVGRAGADDGPGVGMEIVLRQWRRDIRQGEM